MWGKASLIRSTDTVTGQHVTFVLCHSSKLVHFCLFWSSPRAANTAGCDIGRLSTPTIASDFCFAFADWTNVDPDIPPTKAATLPRTRDGFLKINYSVTVHCVLFPYLWGFCYWDAGSTSSLAFAHSVSVICLSGAMITQS